MSQVNRLGIGPKLYMCFHDAVNLIAESDRAVVLIGVNDIENALEKLFLRGFDDRVSKGLRDELFDFSGPLGTYSAKFKLAYAIGLIDRRLYDDLNRLRKIRNDVAHSSTEFSFDDPATHQKLTQLASYAELHSQWGVQGHAPPTENEPTSEYLRRTISVNKLCFIQAIDVTKLVLKDKLASVVPFADIPPLSPTSFALGA